MNKTIEKLLSINRKLIENNSISELLKKAIEKYQGIDELLPEEISNCEAIYKICEDKFPESVGKKPVKKVEEPKAVTPSENETLDFLKNNKNNRIVR